MSKMFVTSDIHFGHTNILKFCPHSRKFKDVQDMNEGIINNWNMVVSPEDTTYILGDVAFCNDQKAQYLINRLNGKKILIVGNHDKKLIKSSIFSDCFEEIHDYYTLNHNKDKIIMFHYPIYEWDGMHRGTYHLYGHLHGSKIPVKGRLMDVGMDTNNCIPYDLDEVISILSKRDIRPHGDGEK